MNLPNCLTLIRVLLIPVFVILIINKSFGWAVVTFAVAGITDGVDGMVARLTHRRTELGAYLDPIADKLLLSSAFVTLAIIEILPSWLTVIVITRDVIILIGFLVLFLTNYRPKIRPSLISKVTTDFQIATVLFVLMTKHGVIFQQLSTLAIYGTMLFTILSGAHYIYVGTRILNGKPY
ncbi:MAG: CDP-alcohol phosphatidyltransferase family protein [Syntrophaceae bacterium]|nr:CDP-alcohol phosphatidyltransferase family protein [Syntrophaceae bacterium]